MIIRNQNEVQGTSGFIRKARSERKNFSSRGCHLMGPHAVCCAVLRSGALESIDDGWQQCFASEPG